MWVLKLVSCFRVTRAEACKLCVCLHIVVAVVVVVAWHECLMRDGSDRQLLPAIGTNAGHTGQTLHSTTQKKKQTGKKRKNTICVVWMWILFVRFFFTSLLLLFCAQCLGFARSCKDSTPLLPSFRSCPCPCTYTFTHSHCLFMSFCLCCPHNANCAIFKRPVLVFPYKHTQKFWVTTVDGCQES